MSRTAKIYMHNKFAGIFQQNEDGYSFTYDSEYLITKNPIPISRTLPLKTEAFQSSTILPFFDGLIPEGWYLEESTNLNPRDRMGLLLSLCKDCVGAVSIVPAEEVSHD